MTANSDVRARRILEREGMLETCPRCGERNTREASTSPWYGNGIPYGEPMPVYDPPSSYVPPRTKNTGDHRCEVEYERLYKWAKLGGPVKFFDFDWDSLEPSRFLASADRYLEAGTYERGVGLSFFGPPGIGKTTALYKVMWNLRQTFGEMLAMTFQDVLHVKEEDRIGLIVRPSVIFIDDVLLGVSDAQKSYYHDKLFDLVDERYVNTKAITLMSTNLTIEQFEDAYPRIADRLRERTVFIEDPNAESFRVSATF